jgi:AraC family transcriptional regulator, regulatory protein of adaptative response / methylphosphotriester-DNA alkyltransferase methyltransferase
MKASTLEAHRTLYLHVRLLVHRHYRRPLTVATLARALAVSPRQITRVYSQFGEITFSEDLLGRRLSVGAQLLLEQPSIPVRDVARLVGFSQPPSFATAFRRRYGRAPSEFRAEGRFGVSSSNGCHDCSASANRSTIRARRASTI